MLRISFVLADHEKNEFVPLGDTDLGPDSQVRRFFKRLPDLPQDPQAPREYLADLRDGDDDTIIDTRIVPAAEVEKYLEGTLAEHEQLGREQNKADMEAIRDRARSRKGKR